jgi:N-acetylmuramic acid 6-phosphate etherase
LFYLGAGTSGRLGVLDASEIPPTFSAPAELVQGLMAGGDRALRDAVEGAEDDAVQGAADILGCALRAGDVVVGISANGGAPYVRGALEAARASGCVTAIVTCNPLKPDAFVPDHTILLSTGPELVAGSTRLKAGTATKLALNMLSTLTMVQLGKVHDNLMVDVRISNKKLRVRAERLVGRLTGLDAVASGALLDQAGGRVKVAAVMRAQGVDCGRAEALLAKSGGFLRPWLDLRTPG